MNGRSQSTQTVCLNLIRVHSDAQAGQTIGFVVADRVTADALAVVRFHVNLKDEQIVTNVIHFKEFQSMNYPFHVGVFHGG